MTQLELFDWVPPQPTPKRGREIWAERLDAARKLSDTEIIDWLPHLAKRMWAERHLQLPHREALIMPMWPDTRRSA